MAKDAFVKQLDGIVLAALAERPLHGYAIIEEIRRRSGGDFDFPEGTIYPVLHRLEAAGLLASEWSEAAGRRRRVYALTRKGQDGLAAHKQNWSGFQRTMSAFLGDDERWPA